MSARNDIPAIPANAPKEIEHVLRRMREEIQNLIGTRGDDPAVRSSTFSASGGGGVTIIGGGIGGGGSTEPDLTPPPSPESFTATPGISFVFVSWAGIGYSQGHGNKQTLIYGVQKNPADATLPVFGDAQVVGQAADPLTIFALPSDPNRRWHLWLKFESVDGVLSVDPTGGVNGVTATTGQDVNHLIEALTLAAEDPDFVGTRFTLRGDLINVADGSGGYSPVFNVVTTPFEQNGVLVPEGVYLSDAYIANGTITNVMIGSAVIDDAKVDTLSAAKFTGGEMRVGSFLQSTDYTPGVDGEGFRIGADGTAELQAAYIRGQLSAGQINANGLSIYDELGGLILHAGSGPYLSSSLPVGSGAGPTIGSLAALAEGLAPAVVTLSSTGLIFVTPANGTTPAPASFTLTASIQNIDVPVYEWLVDGVVQVGEVASTFTIAAFPATAPAWRTIQCNVIGDGGVSGFDVLTVYSVAEGDDALNAGLDNENRTVSCNAAGTPYGGQFPMASKMIVARGAEFLSSGVAFSVVSGSNTGFTTPTINATTGVISIAGTTANFAAVAFRATIGSVTIDRWFRANKVFDGAAGDTGQTVARVRIYRRSATAPAMPTTTATFTFATGAIAGLNNGWTGTIPAGTDPLYVSEATAASPGATDTIASGEWASPVVMAQDGAAGINSATVFLFQRNATGTPPAAPSSTTTYTFATGVLSGTLGSWLQSIPDPVTGKYLFATTATALASAATDSILNTEWAAVRQIAVEGANGSNGTNGARGSARIYVRNDGDFQRYPNRVSPKAKWAQLGTLVGTDDADGTMFDTRATAMILAATGASSLVVGDKLTITNSGASQSATGWWSGTQWIDPGVVIDGNLLVQGTVTALGVDAVYTLSVQGDAITVPRAAVTDADTTITATSEASAQLILSQTFVVPAELPGAALPNSRQITAGIALDNAGSAGSGTGYLVIERVLGLTRTTIYAVPFAYDSQKPAPIAVPLSDSAALTYGQTYTYAIRVFKASGGGPLLVSGASICIMGTKGR